MIENFKPKIQLAINYNNKAVIELKKDNMEESRLHSVNTI